MFPAIPIVGRAKGEGASASIVIAEPKSLLWILDAVAVWGETGCWQHECELGITDISQRPAIFSQHSRCSGLISAKDVRHANSGSATTMIDNAIETNCDALRTMFILPRSSTFMSRPLLPSHLAAHSGTKNSRF